MAQVNAAAAAAGCRAVALPQRRAAGALRRSSSSAASLRAPRSGAALRGGCRGHRAAVVRAAGDDSADSGDDQPSSLPQSTESLFMQELRRRGVSSPGELDRESAGNDSGSSTSFGASAGANPFSSSGPSSIPGADPLNNATTGNDPSMTEDQLEKSRKLNSEGLEGLIPRASELLKLGGSQFLAFLPFMGVGVVLFVGCYYGLGDSFIHGGEVSSGPPPYIDPYLLLEEPTEDPMIPLR